jgi:hypothetical protein
MSCALALAAARADPVGDGPKNRRRTIEIEEGCQALWANETERGKSPSTEPKTDLAVLLAGPRPDCVNGEDFWRCAQRKTAADEP